MSLRIAAARLTELHTVKRMIGGSGGVNPSSDSQTLNVCEGGRELSFHEERERWKPRYVEVGEGGLVPFPHHTERAPRESVVSLVGLTR